MGTRGAFGFRINGQDKVTYNHYDSYPTGLGLTMIAACTKHSLAEMRSAAESIELVDQDKKPTPAQLKKAKALGFLDTSVGEQVDDEWYNLLRGAQGDMEAFIDGSCPFMIDSSGFLYDSLFCEWAYIVNIDEGVLEVYKGFNETPDGAGRYAHKLEPKPSYRDAKYYGVSLRAELPLSNLFGKDDDFAVETAQALELEPEEQES